MDNETINTICDVISIGIAIASMLIAGKANQKINKTKKILTEITNMNLQVGNMTGSVVNQVKGSVINGSYVSRDSIIMNGQFKNDDKKGG